MTDHQNPYSEREQEASSIANTPDAAAERERYAEYVRCAKPWRGVVFGYVIALSMIVTLVGAAGMYAFEGNRFNSYGEALWWTAMIMTTLGSEYWPQTAEGRLLTLLLALFAFAIFGYVTATVATYFIGRDAGTLPEQEENDPPVEQPDHKAIPITGNTTGSNEEFLALQAEVKNLQGQLADLHQALTDLNQALVKNQKDRPGE